MTRQAIEYDLDNPVGLALKGEFEGLQRSELVILVARIRHRCVVYNRPKVDRVLSLDAMDRAIALAVGGEDI